MSTAPVQAPRFAMAPLVPVAASLAVGIIVDRYFEPWRTLTWGTIALVGCLHALVWWRHVRLAIPGIIVAFVALGGGWHHHHWSDLAVDDLARTIDEFPQPAWIQGQLSEVLGVRPGETMTTRAILDVLAIHDDGRWRSASGRVQVVILGERADLEAGQVVEAAGSLAAVAGPLNPGEFDYRAYLRAQGIRLRLTVDTPDGIWGDEGTISSIPSRLIGLARAWSHRRLVAGLDANVAPLAAALLLGRREGVDSDVNDAFARTGTTHLLAISGLHLQVLAGALWFLFRMVGFGRRTAFFAVAMATLGYALLVGLMPSVVRSAAMTITVCIAGMRDRRTRPANTLALAAIVTLLLNPAHLFDVGCQLSFLAIATIVWCVGPVADWLRFAYHSLTFRFQGPGSALDELERRLEPWWLARMRQWPPLVTSGVIVSLVVWLVGLPLVMLRFHVISPIGILLNIPLIPLTSLALMASGLTLVLTALGLPGAGLAAWLSALCLNGTERMVRWGASRSWGHLFVAGPHWSWVLLVYALLVAVVVARLARSPSRRWAWLALGGAIALGPVFDWVAHRPKGLQADILAVGHGLAVVIQDQGGHTLLYDCGRMRDPSVGRRIIAPALWARGVHHLDSVILSHADSDHYNGLSELLDRFSIGSVRVPPGFAGPANPGAVALLDEVRRRGIPIRPIADGDAWQSAGAHFAVWHPSAQLDRNTSDNARSVVLDVEAKGRRLLLTGDLEQGGLADLTRRPSRPIDVFLSPHHGGRSANPAWLYDWAQPKLVVVSQRPPTAGGRDALAPLETAEVPLMRTWKQGAIRLCWEPHQIQASGFLDFTPSVATSSAFLDAFPWIWGVTPTLGIRGLIVLAGFVLGLGVSFVLVVREWGGWALVLPGRRFAGSEPEDFGQTIEAIAADGTPLSATWSPALNAQGKTLILVHGFAEVRPAMRDRIEFLNDRGWNVARLDLRGYGRSGGDRASFGGREGSDLSAWIDVLETKVGRSAPWVVWGRSMGAAIALRAAADDARIAGLILESPYTDLRVAVAGWLRRVRLPFASFFAKGILKRAQSLAGVSLCKPSPLELAPRVPAPTLLIFGTIDPLVTPAQAELLASAFPTPAHRLEVTGAGHGNVVETGGPELLDAIARFLDGVAQSTKPSSASLDSPTAMNTPASFEHS